MAFYHEIDAAKCEVESLKGEYLKRWGWTQTCNSPGAYWLWKRDFSDEDAKRQAWYDGMSEEYRKNSKPPTPYGIIMVPIDMAVSMTVRTLDEQPELGGEED
jgi:hypothetical protein